MTSKFEHETRFKESQESQRSNDCNASGFDELVEPGMEVMREV